MRDRSLTPRYTAPEVLGVYAALKRAAEMSRQIAFLTGTDVIVVKEGRILHESGAVCHDPGTEHPTGQVLPLIRLPR